MTIIVLYSSGSYEDIHTLQNEGGVTCKHGDHSLLVIQRDQCWIVKGNLSVQTMTVGIYPFTCNYPNTGITQRTKAPDKDMSFMHQLKFLN